jgi:hypothetical protein
MLIKVDTTIRPRRCRWQVSPSLGGAGSTSPPVVLPYRQGSLRRSGVRRHRTWRARTATLRPVKPDPHVIPWLGRQLRVRHDDPRLGPYTPRGAVIRSAVELASDVDGLPRVLASTLGRPLHRHGERRCEHGRALATLRDDAPLSSARQIAEAMRPAADARGA